MSLRALGATCIAVLTPAAGLAAEPPPAPTCQSCECAASVPALEVVAALPSRDWKEPFTAPKVTLKSQGELSAAERWVFESFSLELNQPSATATIQMDPAKKAAIILDTKPALQKNPAPPPPWKASVGSVSITGWVDVKFSDVLVRATVSSAVPAGGSQSRQGILARWDKHHSYYWWYLDFSTGKAAIGKQQPGTAAALPLPGSEVAVPGFKKTAAYQLELKVVGPRLKGRVLDVKGKLVVETPEIKDEQPFACGISGVNVEISQNAPFAPLAASFSAVSAEAVREAP
ncbi:MAG TPA: hypothetical protein VND93_12975 [Myxococcales bacterium]|nr:hypothetical protein [Myxococcales bacterium]